MRWGEVTGPTIGDFWKALGGALMLAILWGPVLFALLLAGD